MLRGEFKKEYKRQKIEYRSKESESRIKNPECRIFFILTPYFTSVFCLLSKEQAEF